VQGKEPKCAIVVSVRQAYLHCAKALLRSRLWAPDYVQPKGTFPSISRMVGDQIGLAEEEKKWPRRDREGVQGGAVGAYVVTGQRARQMRVVPAEVLKRLYARSDWHGFVQTAGHLALLIAGGWLVLATLGTWWAVPALLLQGLFVNALFGAMHESVHYGSFRRAGQPTFWPSSQGRRS